MMPSTHTASNPPIHPPNPSTTASQPLTCRVFGFSSTARLAASTNTFQVPARSDGCGRGRSVTGTSNLCAGSNCSRLLLLALVLLLLSVVPYQNSLYSRSRAICNTAKVWQQRQHGQQAFLWTGCCGRHTYLHNRPEPFQLSPPTNLLLTTHVSLSTQPPSRPLLCPLPHSVSLPLTHLNVQLLPRWPADLECRHQPQPPVTTGHQRLLKHNSTEGQRGQRVHCILLLLIIAVSTC